MSLADLTGLEAVTDLIAAIGAGFAALGAVALLFIAAGQLREMLKSRRAQYLPLVIPLTDPALQPTGTANNQEFAAGAAPSTVKFRNMGTGPALNVWAVCFGPQPTVPERTTANRRTAVFSLPLYAGEEGDGDEAVGITVIPGDTSIDGKAGHTLYAPSAPTPGDMMVRDIAPILARYTITYRDIEGRRHASQFDFDFLKHWRNVGFFDIGKDLQELQKEQHEANMTQAASRQGY